MPEQNEDHPKDFREESVDYSPVDEQTLNLRRVLELYPYLDAMNFDGPAEIDCSSTDVVYTLRSPFVEVRFYFSTLTGAWLSDYIFCDEEFGIDYICESAGLDALCERVSDAVQEMLASYHTQMFNYRMNVIDRTAEPYDTDLTERVEFTHYLDAVEENDVLKEQVDKLEREVDHLRIIVSTLQNGNREFD